MTENQQDQQPKYILAINCGSSSIKSKLYLRTQHSEDSDGARKGRDGVVGNESAPGKEGGLLQVAEATIKNIAAKGEKVKVNVRWLELSSDGVSEGERKTVKLGEDKEAETDDVDGAAVDCELGSSFFLSRLSFFFLFFAFPTSGYPHSPFRPDDRCTILLFRINPVIISFRPCPNRLFPFFRFVFGIFCVQSGINRQSSSPSTPVPKIGPQSSAIVHNRSAF